MRAKSSRLGILILLVGAWGCGQKGAKLQKSVVPPDKTLFETGQEYAEKSQFIKARLAFQTLINTYPDSELTAESYFSIGDSFYKEGGTENLLQAEDQYKNFIVFFPTHPKSADAQMKIVALNMRMMRDPDRDQHYSYKAQEALKKFIEMFPDHPYIPMAKQFLRDVQENLARADFGVGEFYAGRGNYRAAKSRFGNIKDLYPEFSEMDEVYWNYAQALEKTENSDEAAIYYGRIVSGWPFSKRFEEAKARLDAMGKPVPAVDPVMTAQNEAKRKPDEGFSPLRPITGFAKALGFIGPPDPYETAKKALAAEEAAVAASQSTAEGNRTAEDILITTELKKTGTGETQAKTVLGSNPNESQPATDKEEEKKADADKKKKNEKKTSPR